MSPTFTSKAKNATVASNTTQSEHEQGADQALSIIIPHNDGLGQHHFAEDPDGAAAMPIANNDKNDQTTEKSLEEGTLIVEKENEVATTNKPSIEVISDINSLDDEKMLSIMKSYSLTLARKQRSAGYTLSPQGT